MNTNLSLADRINKLERQYVRGLISIDEYLCELTLVTEREKANIRQEYRDRCAFLATTTVSDGMFETPETMYFPTREKRAEFVGLHYDVVKSNTPLQGETYMIVGTSLDVECVTVLEERCIRHVNVDCVCGQCVINKEINDAITNGCDCDLCML
jgi:hypothetical protein